MSVSASMGKAAAPPVPQQFGNILWGGHRDFANYRYYPNQLVYNKLKAALDAEMLRRDGDGYGLRQTAGDTAETEKVYKVGKYWIDYMTLGMRAA